MYRRIDDSSRNVVAYSIKGKLCRAEMHALLCELHDEVAVSKCKVNVLIEMEAFPYADFRALSRELTLETRDTKRIERCAVVGGYSGEKQIIKFFDAISAKVTRYFYRSERSTAWAWVKAG